MNFAHQTRLLVLFLCTFLCAPFQSMRFPLDHVVCRRNILSTRSDNSIHIFTSLRAALTDKPLESALDFLRHGSGFEREEDEDDNDDIESEFSEIFEDSAQFDVPYKLIAEIQAREALRIANKGPSSADVNAGVIHGAMERWRLHDNDVGSAEVQVAIAHERVKYLTSHLLQNKKDLAAKRGLQALVVARRKSLEYLSRKNPEKAQLMADELGIRFRPPSSGKDWDRQMRYGAFKNTKSKKAKVGALKAI
mmetsp:Transcript_61821/g.121661  ORF Transcript_61821/g.121661 Transcript_61821/m.121661 type:complete len:250 (+) Transcript_61821:34-783(+)